MVLGFLKEKSDCLTLSPTVQRFMKLDIGNWHLNSDGLHPSCLCFPSKMTNKKEKLRYKSMGFCVLKKCSPAFDFVLIKATTETGVAGGKQS